MSNNMFSILKLLTTAGTVDTSNITLIITKFPNHLVIDTVMLANGQWCATKVNYYP